MATILIAEDDEYLREILQDYLSSKGHKITTVPNGKVAKNVIMAGTFDLVISDVQMPFLNGVELLQWLRTHGTTPFILMTGFTNLLETKKAADLGAQGFLSKPFSNSDLLKLIEEILAPPPKDPVQEPADPEDDYCKVSLEEFVANPKLEFDIFVKLSDVKFLKIAYSGETLDINRVRNYRDKGITHLHIKKGDFGKLVSFNIQLSKMLQASSAVSKEKKLRFMRYTSEVILERCYVAGMDQQAFDEARRFFSNSMEAMTESPEMLNMMDMLNSHSDHLYAHSLGVAIYSIMIAREVKFNSPQTHFKLAMAGMFHDIGKKEIEREILEKSRPLLTVTERKLIESHVQRSREIMESIPGVPADVIQIIYEHHEDEIEQGYPCGTPHLKLHPLSSIVHLADQFVTRAIRSPWNDGASAANAISLIEKFDLDRVDKDAFAALKKIVSQKKTA